MQQHEMCSSRDGRYSVPRRHCHRHNELRSFLVHKPPRSHRPYHHHTPVPTGEDPALAASGSGIDRPRKPIGPPVAAGLTHLLSTENQPSRRHRSQWCCPGLLRIVIWIRNRNAERGHPCFLETADLCPPCESQSLRECCCPNGSRWELHSERTWCFRDKPRRVRDFSPRQQIHLRLLRSTPLVVTMLLFCS